MGIAGTGRLDPIVYPGQPSDHVVSTSDGKLMVGDTG